MKASVFTLGCKVNECESASLAEGLARQGFEVSEGLVYADLYILNTCAVTGEAEKKSRQAVERIRKANPNAKIIVCGCAAQKTPEVFYKKENVVVVKGAMGKGEILDLIGKEGVFADTVSCEFEELPPPKTLKTRAFVRIQDGCNRFCSYCIIPWLRGRSRSRNLESAAEEILSSKAEEVVITGIDVSAYNDHGRDLADLLLAINHTDKRIRFGSLEASVITEKFLQAAKTIPDFAPHFHLSLQSGSAEVLRKMNRHYSPEEYAEKVRLARSYFPDCAITTDIIVGFPTETEQNFEETLRFVEEIRFSAIHCFPYSKRTGTAAAKMQDLPKEIKSERLHRLLFVAEKLHGEYVRKFIGKELSFIPEEDKGGYTVGYSENYIRLYSEGEIKQKCKVVAKQVFEDGLLVQLSD